MERVVRAELNLVADIYWGKGRRWDKSQRYGFGTIVKRSWHEGNEKNILAFDTLPRSLHFGPRKAAALPSG
jgi:hypothetical protein